MKFGVLGNCQAQGFSESIKSFAPGCEVDLRLLIGPNPADAANSASIMEGLLKCDVIFVQVLEHRRSDLTPLITALVETHPKTVRFPVVAFRGFHPDCGHPSHDVSRIPGVYGNYRSILAWAGWLEGLDQARTTALFNAFSYAALGYFDLYDQAKDVFIKQASSMGYNVLPWFDRGAPCFMYTETHPTSSALHDLARQALDLASYARANEVLVPADHLATGPIWPVYPEIARKIGLAEALETTAASSWARPLVDATYVSLETDVRMHGVFDHEGPSQPYGNHIRRARNFIGEFFIRSA